MKKPSIRIAAMSLVVALGFASIGWSQGMGGGGNTGGGNTGGGTTGGGNTGGNTGTGFSQNTGTTGNQNTNQNSNNNSSGGSGSNGNQPLNIADNSQLNLTPTDPGIVDDRNQGFVGATADRIVAQGFVGSATQLSGGQPAAENRSFGGGTNGGGASGGGGTRGGGAATNAMGLRGGAMPGSMNAMNAGMMGNRSSNMGVRRNVRNRLVNKVEFTRVQPQQVTQRFQTRLDRIPTISGAGAGVQISMSNGVARLTGNVATRDAADKIIRQLRLEPGVYQIDNQLSIGTGN